MVAVTTYIWHLTSIDTKITYLGVLMYEKQFFIAKKKKKYTIAVSGNFFNVRLKNYQKPAASSGVS